MIYYPEGHSKSQFRSAPFTYSDIEYAANSGVILEARAALCDASQNLTVSLGCMRGIIPRDECLYVPDDDVKNIAIITRVGKKVCFKVSKVSIDENGLPYALLSRKEAQKECWENYLSALKSGDVIPARVTHLEPFGAFVDIGCGVISMISIEHISVSRILHPSQRFTVGGEVFCAVSGIDADMRRIFITHRELLGTWEENAADFSIGQTAAGIVRGVEDYGIFVELTPNLTGLAEFKEGVHEGQTACVYIKNIIPDKMKIKLIIIDSFCSDSIPAALPYRITEGHIDRWLYSPRSCEKTVETLF